MSQLEQLTVIHSVNRWLPLTENWIYNQLHFLPADIEAHVVCKKTENLDCFPAPHIHALSSEPLWFSLWDRGMVKLGVRQHFSFLVEVAKRTDARILHSHFGDSGWVNLEAAREAGFKHVVTFYGYDVNFLPRSDPRWLTRYRQLFSRVDRILCEGPHMARCIVELGCPEEKVQVQHLGVCLEDIPFHPRCWQPGTPLRVLITASFREKKGIPYALEALGQLRREVDLEVTIIGDAGAEESSRREKARILAAIEASGLRENVRLLGYQPRSVMMQEAYRHHIFLSPSVTAADGDTEGGAPVSIIEMAASGMPVISSWHCDIPEIIRHEVSGLLSMERDVGGIAESLRRLAENPDEWKTMTEAARWHLEQEYDAIRQGEHLAGIYRKLAWA